MMVGDDDLHAQGLGVRDARDIGDAAVDRNQHFGFPGVSRIDQCRRQAVAHREAIGNDVIQMLGTQSAQTAQQQRRAGGAVGIVVAGNADAAARGDGLGEQIGSRIEATQAIRRQQTAQRIVGLRRLGDATSRVDPPHHRMQRSRQRPGAVSIAAQ